MTEPEIHGIHHVTLTVTDVGAAAEWFNRVLGFRLLTRLEHNGLDKALSKRGPMMVTFINHGDADPAGFDERRVGLDHLSFAVTDAELDAWGERLDQLGVTRSPAANGLSGRLIAFRGPDDIALEFYTLPAERGQ